MQPRYLAVAGACLTQFMVIGALFSYGLFFKIFEDEFGWSRTLLSAASALAFFVMGAMAIVGGRLSDRYGPRAVLTVTGACYGAGLALMSAIAEPWQLFAIFGLALGLGLSTHDVVTLSTTARWFERRRGLMTAVVKTGTAVGQVAIPPLAAALIAWLGWRDALVALGVGAGVLLIAAAQMMSLPETPRTAGAPGHAPGTPYAEARGTRIFWTLCAAQFLFFPSLFTVPLHTVVHAQDLGLTPASAAALLSVTGAASVAGRLVIGTLSDRIGGRRGYVVCFLPLIAGLAALLVVAEPVWLFPVMAVYGFAHGGFFTVVSPTVAEYFGLRAHGAIFGTVLFFGTVGGSVGPILAGRIFDVTGSYAPAFATLLGMAITGLLLVLSLPRPAPAISPER